MPLMLLLMFYTCRFFHTDTPDLRHYCYFTPCSAAFISTNTLFYAILFLQLFSPLRLFDCLLTAEFRRRSAMPARCCLILLDIFDFQRHVMPVTLMSPPQERGAHTPCCAIRARGLALAATISYALLPCAMLPRHCLIFTLMPPFHAARCRRCYAAVSLPIICCRYHVDADAAYGGVTAPCLPLLTFSPPR